MQISIDQATLVAFAKAKSGMKLGEMAKEMHVHQTRLSEWQNNKGGPTTDQIAYLADKAGLPIIETIASLKPEWAHVWRKAMRTG